LEQANKEARSGSREGILKKSALEKNQKVLAAGKFAKEAVLTDEEARLAREFQLLTAKPFLYVANVGENEIANFKNESDPAGIEKFIPISAKIESELAELPDEERAAYLKELGMQESGLDRIIRAAYQTLGLITFITAGPRESKAWTCRAGTKAPQAAGIIHTDFEHGFIRAEVIQWDKLLEAGGYGQARDRGWLRVEGKEYLIADGDVVHFRFNA